jgi:hypothetical protein
VRRKNKGRDPILVAVLAEVGAGGITEGWISHRTHYIKGMCQFPGGGITINPAYDVVETLIHEIVHHHDSAAAVVGSGDRGNPRAISKTQAYAAGAKGV